MHINMKYYVVTIGAIFISLGIGILIGFNLNGEMLFSEQQDQIIQKLEERIVQVKSENEILESTVQNLEKKKENLDKYIESTSAGIIEKKLEGQSVGMIYTTEDYFYPDVPEFIQKASGNVVFELLFKDSFVKDLEIKSFNQEMQTSFESKDALVEYILKSVVEDKNFDFVNSLSQKGYLKFTLYDENGFSDINSVVLAAGGMREDKAKMDVLDGNISKYLNQKNINTVGIEKTNVEFSYIPYYKSSKISSVDNVDSISGQISLIMALSGKSGHFGEKETAEELIPKQIEQ